MKCSLWSWIANNIKTRYPPSVRTPKHTSLVTTQFASVASPPITSHHTSPVKLNSAHTTHRRSSHFGPHHTSQQWTAQLILASLGTAGHRWAPLGTAGTAGHRWAPLGTAGHRWTPLGTAGHRCLKIRCKTGKRTSVNSTKERPMPQLSKAEKAARVAEFCNTEKTSAIKLHRNERA